MRERLSVQKAISFTETMTDKIQTEADWLGVSFSEIVRECVTSDLPRRKDRFRKQFSKHNNPRNAVQH